MAEFKVNKQQKRHRTVKEQSKLSKSSNCVIPVKQSVKKVVLVALKVNQNQIHIIT